MSSLIGTVIRRVSTPFNYVSNSYKVYIEKHKGGTIEKWAFYWKGLIADYREVAKDVVEDSRKKPVKALFIATGLGILVYGINTNPPANTFLDQLVENANRLSLVNPSLKNKEVENHIDSLQRCYNQGLIRRLNLVFFSIIWLDNYNRALDLFASQCTYLKPRYLTFHERIVDFGMFDKYWMLDFKMKDYDVNLEEWQ